MILEKARKSQGSKRDSCASKLVPVASCLPTTETHLCMEPSLGLSSAYFSASANPSCGKRFPSFLDHVADQYGETLQKPRMDTWLGLRDLDKDGYHTISAMFCVSFTFLPVSVNWLPLFPLSTGQRALKDRA